MSKLLTIIKKIPKTPLTFRDIAGATSMNTNTLRVSLHRLMKHGDLISLRKGLYSLADKDMDIERIAAEMCYPSYFSCEWALAHHGLIHQIPYRLELMTPKRSRTLSIGSKEISVHHLKMDLFWGYEITDGIWMATPEKAIIDILYLRRLGKKTLPVDEIRWKSVNRKKLLQFARKTRKSFLVLACEGLNEKLFH